MAVGGIGFRLVIKPEVDGTLEVGVGKRYDLWEMNGQSDGHTQAGYDIGTAGAIEVTPFNLSGVFIGPVNMVVWHIECKVEGTAKAGEKGSFCWNRRGWIGKSSGRQVLRSRHDCSGNPVQYRRHS